MKMQSGERDLNKEPGSGLRRKKNKLGAQRTGLGQIKKLPYQGRMKKAG
jgi:hypothetical protein